MIKLENTVLPSTEQWEAIIRGMRNPMNSWDKSDSHDCEWKLSNCVTCINARECAIHGSFELGPNDKELMTKLAKAGSDHSKYRRMIVVYVDITAPLYWWKEFDTYKVGTVANSCSTMHKIHEKEFTLEDFSCEHLIKEAYWGIDNPTHSGDYFDCHDILELTVEMLNHCRSLYLLSGEKVYWDNMIQLLPSSYNQRRTVMLNYQVLANIYPSRKNHKLQEWHDFCDWIKSLPYSELITGEDVESIYPNIPKEQVHIERVTKEEFDSFLEKRFNMKK